MKTKKPYGFAWLMVLIILVTGSCTEVIDIELDSTFKRLVVYGVITNDSVKHEVHLSSSSDYFSNQPSPKLSGALVELEFDDHRIRLLENDSIPGLYHTPEAFRGVPETRYKLFISEVDVDMDGNTESYQAESTMPAVPLLDSISLLYFRSPFISGYQILMYANDRVERDWYSFKIWKNQQPLTTRLSDYFVQTDDFFNGTYIFGLPVGFLSDDDPEEAVVPGDTVLFELNSIGEEYYNFITDAQLEIAGNNPLFSGPSANVRSNLDNGAKGVFSAYSINRVSLVVELDQ